MQFNLDFERLATSLEQRGLCVPSIYQVMVADGVKANRSQVSPEKLREIWALQANSLLNARNFREDILSLTENDEALRQLFNVRGVTNLDFLFQFNDLFVPPSFPTYPKPQPDKIVVRKVKEIELQGIDSDERPIWKNLRKEVSAFAEQENLRNVNVGAYLELPFPYKYPGVAVDRGEDSLVICFDTGARNSFSFGYMKCTLNYRPPQSLRSQFYEWYEWPHIFPGIQNYLRFQNWREAVLGVRAMIIFTRAFSESLTVTR